MAVVRKSGSVGPLRLWNRRRRLAHALDHADFHAAFRRALQLHVVHEVADEEDAAAARLEQVLRRERVGDRLRIEAFALIADANHQLGLGRRRRFELDEHALGRVVAVAVLDGVDDRLADRDADPVDRVLVEARCPPDVVADDLHEVEHLEGAGELEADDLVIADGHEWLAT